jgi:cellulose synthase/poly-beta-1,6-N-acetylglucosamine synthase-like glycosyltransferase
VQALYNFVFFYPLFMAFLWMFGSTIFHLFRRGNREERSLPATPLVSILVPCHNEEDCIKETVEFLMEQDYPDFEIIAIDDGSTDNTVKILHKLQQKCDRLRVVCLKSNRGKGTAMTMGALASRSEYLVCIDADALLDTQAVRHYMWHFLNFPRVGAVTGNPRVRNRTSILGKIQMGEFSSLVNMIKRTQRILGKIKRSVSPACKMGTGRQRGAFEKLPHASKLEAEAHLAFVFGILCRRSVELCFCINRRALDITSLYRSPVSSGGSENIPARVDRNCPGNGLSIAVRCRTRP